MNIPELQSVIQALGWTLVHFLWQGAAMGLLFGLVMRATASASAWLRYRLALALFIGVGMLPVVTFQMVLEASHGPAAALGLAQVTAHAGSVSAQGGLPWMLALERALEPYLAWAVALWLAGVIVMSGRVCLDWWQVRRLTWVGVEPLPAPWDDRVEELVRTFAVSRPVRVLRSTIVRVPAVIGWVRPVVLIPAAALAGLSARQLELIIAHELAHIRRADYLVNLLQVAIETVLFYHPAVRWMSNRVRQEREICCDDAVVATCGDTLTYAHALTELEAQRQAGFQTALAASGGHLSQRIYRMLDRPTPRRNTLIWSMSLVVGLAAGSMALAAQLALTGVAKQGTEAPVAKALGQAAPSIAELPTPAAPQADPPETSPEVDDEAQNPGPAETPAPKLPAADTNADTNSSAAMEPELSTTSAEPAADVSSPEASNGRDSPSGEPVAAAAPEGREEASPAVGTLDPVIPEAEIMPDTQALARLDLPVPAEGDTSAGAPEPTRLARATRPESKAAEPARPEVRGGEPLHVPAPEYPRRARVRGLQGSVAAEFTIGRDGKVRDIELAESSPAGVFDRSVLQALAEWQFRPMTREGERVTRRVSKVFEFNLADGSAASTKESDECDPITGSRICR